jgi:hypothetical protein
MTTQPPLSPFPSDGVDLDLYRWHLTRAHVDYVLHYTHWIPIGRGFTQQMLAKYYPGWTLGGLIAVFDAAKIRIRPNRLRGAHGAPHGGRCHWQVEAFYFTDAQHFHVVRNRKRKFDKKYLAHDLTDDTRRPGGVGPSRGREIAAVEAPRAVDLSGEKFFV